MAKLVKIGVSKLARDRVNAIRDDLNNDILIKNDELTQGDIIDLALTEYLANKSAPASPPPQAAGVPGDINLRVGADPKPQGVAPSRPHDNMSKMLGVIKANGKDSTLIMKTLGATLPQYMQLWQGALRLGYVHAEMGKDVTVTALGAEYMTDRS
tara:strand:+ start:5996 stop:6460 length:465 start_codon:yes stop_codon:yes gene_type:complete